MPLFCVVLNHNIKLCLGINQDCVLTFKNLIKGNSVVACYVFGEF